MKPRRNAFDKERFLEGNRQKWAGLFTLMGLLVLVCSAYGWVKDPAAFLQFFLSIGVTFILGASASDVMKSWKTDSSSKNSPRYFSEHQGRGRQRPRNKAIWSRRRRR